jgi:HlyD family secretion protein
MAGSELVASTRRTNRAAYGSVGLTLVLFVTAFVAHLNPPLSDPPPSIERGTVWPDTVRRGPMIRQVRGSGALVPASDATRLKAVLQIPKTQAGEIAIGQPASVDTRHGIVPGKVARLDTSPTNGAVSVDIALTGALPRGARPGLTVDGAVELERMENVVHVGRPAFGQENSTVTLFKVTPGCDLTLNSCEAVRQWVRLGRSSINTIEILDGLKPGDQVVLSDMSAWDGRHRVRLN